MVESLQVLFLLLLAASVIWLVYLAQHQDAAGRADGGRPLRDDGEARPFRVS